MLSKQRVINAINRKENDRFPVSGEFTVEAMNKCKKHFNTNSEEDVFKKLEIDTRVFYPIYKGDFFNNDDDKGNKKIFGGSIVSTIQNKFGSYNETTYYSLNNVISIKDIDDNMKFPILDDFDFNCLKKQLSDCEDYFCMLGINNSFQIPISNMEMSEFLMLLYTDEELAKYIIKKSTDFCLTLTEKMLIEANGRIDCVMCADDFATQNGALISLDMFRKFFKLQIQRFIDLAKRYKCYVYMHCCGAASFFYQDFIEMGIDIVDPVQTTAKNMEPNYIKERFGQYLTFHGAVNTQGILNNGTNLDVKENIKMLKNILGKDGGYIIAPCHYIQADVPLKNIIELYDIKNRYV